MFEEKRISNDAILEAHAIAIEELGRTVIALQSRVKSLEDAIRVHEQYITEGWYI